MYRSVNINDDVYYSEILQKNKRKNLLKMYIILGIFMLLFLGISTFDIIYWKGECNLNDSIMYFENATNTYTENINQNITNIPKISKVSQYLQCFIFLYGVTFYFYLLLMCLASYSLWCYNSSEEINNESVCRCILSSLSGFARDIIILIIWIIFILVVFLRIALFIIMIIQYRICQDYCNNANVLITLIPFSIEFIINIMIIVCGLCFIYMCLCYN